LEIPRVAVVMPHYGDVSLKAARAFHNPSTRTNIDPSLFVEVATWIDSQSSITPDTFNHLLANALGLRDQGTATHLAMIHSDVEPEGPWLNALWCEMARTGADVVSSVIPIKNRSGRTSTAIGDAGDRWAVKRFITLDDRDTLPATFTAEDCCGPGEVLLVNTGLWLADLRRDWWDGFAFQWHTRITKEGHARRTWVRPEDWEMSRDLAEAGAKVAATWAVNVVHCGNGRWANYPEGK
jgi:hypothetical protein